MKRMMHELQRSANLYFIIFGIVLQVILFVVTIHWLGGWSVILSSILTVISVMALIWILNNYVNPEIKLAWAVLILAFPMVGGIVYLVVERDFSFLKAKKKYAAVQKKANATPPACESVLQEMETKNLIAASQYNYLYRNNFPIYKQTECNYYPMADLAFAEILDALRNAEQYIFIEYYIISYGDMWTEILEVLILKAKAGVEVRVLYDDLGCKQLLPHGYRDTLAGYGIQSVAFNQIMPIVSVAINNRDHRKIAVIDGKTAFVGGFNLSDEYINLTHPHGVWKDIGVKLQGDAVQSITKMFLIMWNFARDSEEDFDKYLELCSGSSSDGYIQPYAFAPYDGNLLVEKIYLNIINQSLHYLYIYTPYLIVDHNMQNALIMAAERGVDVKLILPGIPDSKLIDMATKASYPDLIAHGIGIYEYEPGFIHGKGIVCDDILAAIGSSNFDYRSLYHHFENGCLFFESKVVMDFKMDFENTLLRCKQITNAPHCGWFMSGFYSLLRVVSPLL